MSGDPTFQALLQKIERIRETDPEAFARITASSTA